MEAVDEEIKNEPAINPIPASIVHYQMDSGMPLEESKQIESEREFQEEIKVEVESESEPGSVVMPPMPDRAPNVDLNLVGDQVEGDPGFYYDYYRRERLEHERKVFLNLAVIRGIYEIIYLVPVIILYLINKNGS